MLLQVTHNSQSQINWPNFCMKSHTIFGLLLLQLVAAAEPKPHFVDSISSEELSLKFQRSNQRDPMKTLVKIDAEDPSKSNQPVNLLEQSDIVCFGGLATLVPKRAILATPTKYKDCLTLRKGSKIVGWSEFFAVNRGWITTVEVSRVQAEGNKALPKETSDRIGKSMNLVVATFSGGPISVLPLKQPEASHTTVKVTP